MKQHEFNKQLFEFISFMPKIELHLHLEGAFTVETLFRLIKKYGGDSTIKSVDDIKKKFMYKSFNDFIETWYWKNNFFRKGEDFEISTYETLLGLKKQKVVYIEAFFSPWDFEKNGIPMEEITESVIYGCERAERDSGIRWKLIADLNRDHGPEAAFRRIEKIAVYKNRGIIGIGLGGNETLYPASLFTEVFRAARSLGLRRVAHAGEAAGAESVSSALFDLKAERIGHGVRAIEDARIIKILKESQTPLEVCITSNVLTGSVQSVTEHPVKQFIDHGLNVTINTDDPTMFNCTISDEYFLLLGVLKCSLSDIKRVCYNALNSSFLEQDVRNAYKSIFDDVWKHAPQNQLKQNEGTII